MMGYTVSALQISASRRAAFLLAQALKRDTVLAYLSRRHFRRIPRPNRVLSMGPLWYEKTVREWEAKEEGGARDR
jgi:hypothetical protein